jgi:NADPH-dependent 2,4-dienoyl-CoA reductase/sulfur reductase-like enzyme
VLTIDDAWRAAPGANGQRIVVLDESPFEGTLDYAVYCAANGAQVDVVTTQEHVGKGLDQVSLVSLQASLRGAAIGLQTLTELAGIDDAAVVTRCLCTGRTSRIDCDTLVLGIPPLTSSLDDKLFSRRNVHIIGDALFPRGTEYALADARELVLSLETMTKAT